MKGMSQDTTSMGYFFYLIRASHIANFCLRQWVGLLGSEREERLAMREVV